MSGSSGWGPEMGPIRPPEGEAPRQVGEVLPDLDRMRDFAPLVEAVFRQAQAASEASYFSQTEKADFSLLAQHKLLDAQAEVDRAKAELAAKGYPTEQIASEHARARQDVVADASKTATALAAELEAARQEYRTALTAAVTSEASSDRAVQELIARMFYLRGMLDTKLQEEGAAGAVEPEEPLELPKEPQQADNQE